MATKKKMTKKFKKEFRARVEELKAFVKENYPEADYFDVSTFLDDEYISLYLTQGEYKISGRLEDI